MNQYGMIFWTLLSIYLLIRALQAATFLPTVIFTLGSMWAVRMALWSYESALFIIFLVPLMLLAFRFRFRLRPVLIACAYYVSPVSYAWDSYQRYSHGSSTYQQSVLRSNMSPGPILSDWWFNITNSLEFWNWSWAMPAVTAHVERHVLGLTGAALAAVVVAGAALTAKRRGATLPDRRSLVYLLACGVVILVASFPAYVILSSARQLWRTQFLSSIGAGLVLGSIIALAATIVGRSWAVAAIAAIGAGAIAYFGVLASFTDASFEYSTWTKEKHTVEEVVSLAPRLERGTVVVLVDVPQADDSFGNNMWFDFGVRLAYPRELVSGIYFYPGGTPSPGENLALHNGFWEYTNTGYATLVRRAPVRNSVIIRYSPTGAPRLLQRLPAFLHATPAVESAYDPGSPNRIGAPVPLRDPAVRADRKRAALDERRTAFPQRRSRPTGARKRLLIFVVAYNAERTIESVLARIPESLTDQCDVEILVIDDASADRTFERGERVRRDDRLAFPLHVLFNPVNQGYGGNQKIGFHFALNENFDFVALLHGDGQYAPESLPNLARPLALGRRRRRFWISHVEPRRCSRRRDASL